MMKKGSGKKNSKSKRVSSQLNDEVFYLFSIIKNMPGSVYWKDLQGKYIGCNDSLLEMAGMSSVIGKTDFDMPWASEAAQIRENDLKVMTLNATMELEEYPTLANGQQTVVLTRKTPLRNERGDTVGIIGISVNITERIKYQSTLESLNEQTESTLKNIVANMPGHVYWKDRKGVYLGCNILQAASLGFTKVDDIIGKTDFDLPWGKNIGAPLQKNDARIMERGKAEIIEEETLVNGQIRIVLSHKAPMLNKRGEITGILGISIDITDRKKIETELKEAKERAEAANEAKTEFLDNMRHDIRTPLTGITGFANIIGEEVDDPKIKEYVENLSASSDALLNLLNEILEIIEINSGVTPRVQKKFNLEDRLGEVINLYKAKAKQKNIELVSDYDKAIPHYLIGDSLRIHRIALELIANAFNFTQTGLVKLTTKLAKADGRNLIIKLSVADSGIGIAPNKQDEIFQQFKRLTPAYQGVFKGAGLGLTIVKEFVNDLQGEIYIESEVGKGSTFTCILPIKAALLDESLGSEIITAHSMTENLRKSTAKFTANSPKKDYQSCPRSKILVVEDNFIAATVAQALLSHLHCAVDLAFDGKTALQLALQNDYDLIFMDIGLPDINGLETTRRIRLQELNKKLHVPIIALTAHLDEDNKQNCLQIGMNAVLTKPLTKEKAKEILQAFVPFRKSALRLEQDNLTSMTHAPFHLEGKIIDFDLMLAQTGGHSKLAKEMLDILIQSFPEELAQFNHAHKTKDWSNIQKLAHKMKSGATYCGTIRLKSACDLLELAIKNQQQDLYEPLYRQLLQQIELVEREHEKSES